MSERCLGAILAAGRGSRVNPLGRNYPKSLLPIANKPLIVHQLEVMQSLGIRDVAVLVGHRGSDISNAVGTGRDFGVSVQYVRQSGQLGIAHALGKLQPHLDRPFLLCLGDIYFAPRNMSAMFDLFEQQKAGAVLAVKEDDPAAVRRNFSVSLSPSGAVSRVVEKPRDPETNLKGVGVYLFDPIIFEMIRRTPRTALRDEYELTDSIQLLIDAGTPVWAAHVTEHDVNLTTPADLLSVNLAEARAAPGGRLIGQACRLAEGVTIEEAVVGSGVTVTCPIAIRRSVIFDHATIDSPLPIENAIVTKEMTVQCEEPA